MATRNDAKAHLDALAIGLARELGIETLEVQGRDRYDFREVYIPVLKRVLQRAVVLGMLVDRKGRKVKRYIDALKATEAKGDRMTKTASETYEAATKRAHAAIAEIQSRLAAHAAAQRTNPDQWGFVGDINHVAAQLAEVATFLGPRRPED